MNENHQQKCVVCGGQIIKLYNERVCYGCGESYGHVPGLTPDQEVSRVLAALLQIERRQHAETRRRLAKAEHDRDRYHRRVISLMEGIRGIIGKADKLCCPPCKMERQV